MAVIRSLHDFRSEEHKSELQSLMRISYTSLLPPSLYAALRILPSPGIRLVIVSASYPASHRLRFWSIVSHIGASIHPVCANGFEQKLTVAFRPFYSPLSFHPSPLWNHSSQSDAWR